MSWFQVYRLEDGVVVSGTNDSAKVASPEVLANRGYGVKEFADGVQNGIWNPVTLDFDVRPEGPIYVRPEAIIAALGPTKWAAAKQITDDRITWWYDRLAMRSGDPVDITGATFKQGIQLLIAQAILTEEESVQVIDALKAGE